MVTIAVAARFSPARSGTVVERDFKALRGSPMFWVFVLSGLLEPLLYLLAIGLGVGRLVGTDIPYLGHEYSYLRFVAPAMLAVSSMSGALAASAYTFYGKLRGSRIFETIFVTPVRVFEIAVAELTWAVVRGMMFSVAFLAVLVAMGLSSGLGVLFMLPATILIGLAFGAVGMGISTLIRGWQDFDMLVAAQVALFLFSATFTPITRYPEPFRVLIELTPLYHGVELLRGLSLGDYRLALLWHAGYLLAVLVAGLFFAYRRLEKTLRQ